VWAAHTRQQGVAWLQAKAAAEKVRTDAVEAKITRLRAALTEAVEFLEKRTRGVEAVVVTTRCRTAMKPPPHL
jgi:hypothetical protein